MSSNTTFSNPDLLEACAQNGCPICRIGAQTVKRYLKSIFYEYVNDIPTRNRLNKRLGLCSEHAQLLLNTRIADTLGASIIYENIVKIVLREFPKSSPIPKEAAKWINRFLGTAETNGECVACEQREALTVHTLKEMSSALSDTVLQTALQSSDGLCFPHLATLLEQVKKPEDAAFLMELTQSKLITRQSEMAEVIRKSDYRSSSEKMTQEEAVAWKKSMCMVSGVSISLTGEKHE
jgi:hypothetical protein